MNDLISRQAAIEVAMEELESGTYFDIPSKIKDLPSEQTERKRGKWIVYKAPDKQHCGLIKCPFCGEDMIAEADEYNFCPNCGAQMER